MLRLYTNKQQSRVEITFIEAEGFRIEKSIKSLSKLLKIHQKVSTVHAETVIPNTQRVFL